ncbi:hypothetical protein ACIGN6_28880 [Streptomyces sp. NPDC053792]|uniref:hypothetical protein n=1 Tax=Streptomyces sp. NPDC053792 TaxID=3365716 RepID=UPI0037D6A63A
MTEETGPPEGTPVTFEVPINELFARVSAQFLKDIRELVTDGFPKEFGGPQSQLQRDAAAFEALPEPTRGARRSMQGMIVQTVQLSWTNALDQIRALEQDVVMQPPPVWSPLTLSRGVMESCLLLHYMIEPVVPVAKRLARCAGVWWSDIDHMRKAASAFGEEQVAGVAEKKAYVDRALADVGAVERTNNNGRLIGFEVDGEKAALDINFTEAAAALPSYLPAPYRLLSGAAHGRPWMIGRAGELTQGTGASLVGEAATVMTAVMAVYGSLETALSAWGGYFGMDFSELRKRLDERRNAFFMEAVISAYGEGQ